MGDKQQKQFHLNYLRLDDT